MSIDGTYKSFSQGMKNLSEVNAFPTADLANKNMNGFMS